MGLTPVLSMAFLIVLLVVSVVRLFRPFEVVWPETSQKLSFAVLSHRNHQTSDVCISVDTCDFLSCAGREGRPTADLLGISNLVEA